MKNKNEKGFSAVEIILVIVVVALIGVVGWIIYKDHHKTNPVATTVNSSSTKPSSSSSPTTTQSSNPTANWTSVTSGDNKFSVKYPATWVLAADTSSCYTNEFLVGPTSSSSGSCSPGIGDSEISFGDTDHPCLPLSSTPTTQQVTVSGVSGKEYTGSSDGSTVEVNTIGPSGTKYIEYCLFATSPSITYEATYIQLPGYPDVSSDFNLMVTKTLSFN